MIQGHMRFLLLCVPIMVLISCSNEDENPVLPDPTLSVEEGDFLEVKRGEAITVTILLDATAGNKDLIVYRGGGVLETVPLNQNAASVTYSNQSVPDDAQEGEEIEYEFAVVNTQGTVSARIPLTVSTVAYDAVTVGSETLYQVTIPEGGLISEDYKFVTGRKYLVANSMDFQSGTTLTVEPGVEIYMSAGNTPLNDIIIREGAQIDMQGTAEQPIIITSENVLTDNPANPGDWGWLNIRGEGPGSNSGIVRYVRSEYGGARNFRLQGVGAATVIDHVQVYKASGEGIMSTDGDVNMKYLVATDCEGGAYRFGDAYAGSIQFGLAMTSTTYDDNSEVDIRETSTVRLANFSIIGPGRDAENTAGIRMRGNSSGKIYNSIVASYPRRGVRLNDDITVTDLEGPTVFAYSYVFDVRRDPYRDDTDHGNPFMGFVDDNGSFQNPFFNNVTGLDGDDPELISIDGIGTNNPVPTASQASDFDPETLAGAGFESAPFVGAIQDADNDWTVGWVKNADGSIR